MDRGAFFQGGEMGCPRERQRETERETEGERDEPMSISDFYFSLE